MTTLRSQTVTDAVRRALEIDDLGEQLRLRLSLSTAVDLAPARLWPLLTTPDGLASWYGPVQGELGEGGRFSLPAAEGSLLALTGPDPVEGSVLEVEGPHRLVLSWERGDHTDLLTLLLDPEDDGTTSLVLTHTLVRERADVEERGPGVWAVGWELALLALAAETDGWRSTCGSLPECPTGTWLAGDRGVDALEAWAVRWAAEALAAGLDEEQARRGEEATRASVGPGSPAGHAVPGPPVAGAGRTTLPLTAARRPGA